MTKSKSKVQVVSSKVTASQGNLSLDAKNMVFSCLARLGR